MAIFFEDENVQTFMRKEVHTFTDFLAICGGLLGLFLGISALSIIEIIYYMSLRLFWTIRRLRSEHIAAAYNQQVINVVPFDGN